jgi:hypothetical protein
MIYILANTNAQAVDYAREQTWLSRKDWRYVASTDILRNLRGLRDFTIWLLPNYDIKPNIREYLDSLLKCHIVNMPENRSTYVQKNSSSEA